MATNSISMSKTRFNTGTYQRLSALPAISVLEGQGGAWGLLAVKEPLKQRRLALQRRPDDTEKVTRKGYFRGHFRSLQTQHPPR